jgi:hypothetical protein
MKPRIKRWCLFEILLTEILIDIFLRLGDLPTLHRLLRASPTAYRMFNSSSSCIYITEALISNSHEEFYIPGVIRLIAMIRSSAIPAQNLEEFTTGVLRYNWSKQTLGDSTLPKLSSQDTSPAALCGVLALAHEISCLTNSCFEHYVNRLMLIQPERLPEGDISHRQAYGRGHPTSCLDHALAEHPAF